MIVAFVSLGDPNDPHYWSGIPYHMLRSLVAENCRVEVVAPLDRSFRYLYLGQKLLEKLSGPRFDIDRQPLALASYRDQINRRLKGSAVDVVFSPSSIPIAMLDGHVPVVYWTDAVWEALVDYYEGFSNLSQTARVNGHRQEQMAMDRAALGIYSNDWAAQAARKYYKFSPSKIKVIPFGANLEVKHDSQDVRGFVKQRRKDHCRLLFLGVDWVRKGGDLALQAARLLNEAGLPTTLTVVGCDPFRKKDTPAFVEKIGFISKRTESGRRTLEHLLSVSHFLLLPTRAEAGAIVFCEASAYGLPSVTTDTGGLATYVRSGVNGVRLPLKAAAEDYAREILKMFEDRHFYEELSLSSFNEFKTRLNWQTSVRSLIRVMIESGALHANRTVPVYSGERSLPPL